MVYMNADAHSRECCAIWFLENYILQLVTAYSRFVNLGKFSYLSLHNDAVYFAAMGGYKTTSNFNGRIWMSKRFVWNR